MKSKKPKKNKKKSNATDGNLKRNFILGVSPWRGRWLVQVRGEVVIDKEEKEVFQPADRPMFVGPQDFVEAPEDAFLFTPPEWIQPERREKE